MGQLGGSTSRGGAQQATLDVAHKLSCRYQSLTRCVAADAPLFNWLTSLYPAWCAPSGSRPPSALGWQAGRLGVPQRACPPASPPPRLLTAQPPPAPATPRLRPRRATMTGSDVYLATKLSCAELLLSGCTCSSGVRCVQRPPSPRAPHLPRACQRRVGAGGGATMTAPLHCDAHPAPHLRQACHATLLLGASGTPCCTDHHYIFPNDVTLDDTIRAAREMGIRCGGGAPACLPPCLPGVPARGGAATAGTRARPCCRRLHAEHRPACTLARFHPTRGIMTLGQSQGAARSQHLSAPAALPAGRPAHLRQRRLKHPPLNPRQALRCPGKPAELCAPRPPQAACRPTAWWSRRRRRWRTGSA